MLYPENFEDKAGFTRIRELVKEKCGSVKGLEFAGGMTFMNDHESILARLSETNELKAILVESRDFQLGPVPDISSVLGKLGVEGRHLDVDEVKAVRTTLETSRALLNFFAGQDQERYPYLRRIIAPVKLYPYLSGRIDTVLNKQGQIRDNATRELQAVRSAIRQKQGAAVKLLNQLLRHAQSEGFADKEAVASVRDGRPVIPVDATHKRAVRGIIHDQSSSGKTIFIEPAEIVEANNEIRELEYQERREVIKILLRLTDDFRPYAGELESAGEFLGRMDFIQAKARFALDINGVMPSVVDQRLIRWEQAMHPLLYLAHRKESREVVPQDISLDSKRRILLVSGPNAGGKSVCLQTVGLLQYMLQCGVLIPVREDSQSGIFERIFINIGDEQSIENDLSTYSSHLRNMNYFIRHGDGNTLLLIDELGAGTDPLLGGAIAEAVLEAINDKGCYGVMTTHYSNLKHYAASAVGIENAAMMFDNRQMRPMFKLVIGQPGSSFAFEIARNIGLPEKIIGRATGKIGSEQMNFERHLRELIRDRKYWESKRDKIRQSERRLQQVLSEYARELETTREQRKKILAEAKREAEELLAGTNKQIENTIRQIREAQAGKEKTRLAREELEAHRQKVSRSLSGNEGENERKARKVREEEKKIRERRKRFGQLKEPVKEPEKKPDGVIRTGDHVVLKGHEIPGEVVSVSGRKAKVNFGSFISKMETDKLEKVDARQYLVPDQKASGRGDLAEWDVSLRRLQFRTEIDVRGQRAEEAIRKVTEFIDEALVVQAGEVRILHGKGDGVLRTVIREYLNTLDFIEKYHDEHVQLGGAGITVVQLNL